MEGKFYLILFLGTILFGATLLFARVSRSSAAFISIGESFEKGLRELDGLGRQLTVDIEAQPWKSPRRIAYSEALNRKRYRLIGMAPWRWPSDLERSLRSNPSGCGLLF